MALGTRARIMAARFGMAVGAIRVVVVNEPDLSPVVNVVAGRTLAGFVGNWCGVAAGTIILAAVIKGDFVPGVCSVAGDTGSKVVGNRCLVGVAALAIFQAVMIDDEGRPVGGVMTAGALFAGMVFGWFVAGGAVGVAGVVEYGRFPILRVMAGSTFKMVMGRWVVFQVAG